MNRIYACIDGQSNSRSVIDWSAWAAQRLAVPLEFLHVLERHPERASTQDFSGAIGLGAQEAILQNLSESDALHSKAAIEAGRQLLSSARERAASAGVAQLDGRLRHGEFVATVQELEAGAQLLILGEHYHAAQTQKVHFDHHLEEVIRATRRSVLVATRAQFAQPTHFALAFDGSSAAFKTIELISSSPLLAGLTALVVMAGSESALRARQLEEARQALQKAGFEVKTQLIAGEPNDVLPAFVNAQGADLLVMGAFGHSWLKQLIAGSTTSTLLRVSDVPVLILR
ncbi:universal stress protein [Rhodoferax sp.]|uniref:universal stress protein n=1 Tax=Rhodoferax sp. TaxID=50421 RepID=UPI0025D2BB2A|nr:universal stress protein [Rhodoferax sp.]